MFVNILFVYECEEDNGDEKAYRSVVDDLRNISSFLAQFYVILIILGLNTRRN